jgi:hypothetical protein
MNGMKRGKIGGVRGLPHIEEPRLFGCDSEALKTTDYEDENHALLELMPTEGDLISSTRYRKIQYVPYLFILNLIQLMIDGRGDNRRR